MSQKLVLLSLIAMHVAEAAVPPCTTTLPPVVATTTPACGDLCKGLVGSAAGLAGLGAIGGIVAATMGTKKPPTAAPPTPGSTPGPTTGPTPSPPTPGPTVGPTTLGPTVSATLMVDPRQSSSDGWLWPLLLGLLALCCCLALMGYFCMGQKKKAPPKKKTKAKPPAVARPVVAPEPEAAPLMSGHYEQPMSLVPVGYEQPSYMPTMVETVAPVASTYMPAVGTSASYMPMAAPSYMPMAASPYGIAPTQIV